MRPPAPGEALAAGAPAAVRVDAAAGAVDVVAGRCAALELAQARESHIISELSEPAVVECGAAPHIRFRFCPARGACAPAHRMAWPWADEPSNRQRLWHCASFTFLLPQSSLALGACRFRDTVDSSGRAAAAPAGWAASPGMAGCRPAGACSASPSTPRLAAARRRRRCTRRSRPWSPRCWTASMCASLRARPPRPFGLSSPSWLKQAYSLIGLSAPKGARTESLPGRAGGHSLSKTCM